MYSKSHLGARQPFVGRKDEQFVEILSTVVGDCRGGAVDSATAAFSPPDRRDHPPGLRRRYAKRSWGVTRGRLGRLPVDPNGALPPGRERCLHAGLDVELGQDVGDMRPNGALAYTESPGDMPIGQAIGQ
jgi:hypothetical protein